MRRFTAARTAAIMNSLLILVFLTGCSQISLFTLLSSEQEGDFRLDDEVVNIEEDKEYQISARGGFLPYSYTIISGSGSIDPVSGLYTAPSGVTDYIEV